jgi:uncharacterized protein YkwD
MRTFAVSVAAGVALLVGTPAQAEVSNGQATWQLRKTALSGFVARLQARSVGRRALVTRAALRPTARRAVLSTYEADIVRRINAIRASRGRRPLRVSRQLSAAAAFHTNQMGLRGFFEHESANGAPFWKRVERFYPALAGRGWSVGENILWGSPDISPAAAVREWMQSPPHRENILSREWREIGIAAIHFASAPGEYGGRPVTIVTADFGTRA